MFTGSWECLCGCTVKLTAMQRFGMTPRPLAAPAAGQPGCVCGFAFQTVPLEQTFMQAIPTPTPLFCLPGLLAGVDAHALLMQSAYAILFAIFM